MATASEADQDKGKNSFGARVAAVMLWPGNWVCDRLGVEEGESRFLLRMFVNLTVYGKVAVILLWPFLHV